MATVMPAVNAARSRLTVGARTAPINGLAIGLLVSDDLHLGELGHVVSGQGRDDQRQRQAPPQGPARQPPRRRRCLRRVGACLVVSTAASGMLRVMEANRSDQLERWERRTAGVLTVLAVLFIVVYAVPILRPDLAPVWRRGCEITNLAIWGLFVIDYLVRLVLSRSRWNFVRSHLFDLIVLLLPLLRPLRMLRLVTALLVLNRRTERWTRGRLAVYVGGTTVLLVVVGALAILDAERGSADSNIGDYPQALWWAIVTITTVGYGDFYPTTVTGRFVALALMIGGIGLIGFVTGSLATWIVERISTADRPAEATKDDIAAVLHELGELRTEVAALRAVADRAGHAAQPPP